MGSPGWSLNGNRLTTSDNVGIGTATPAATLDVGGGLLHVGGTTTPTTTAQGAYLGWNALTTGTGETDFINNQGLGTGGFAFMNTPPSGNPRTTLMVITGSGEVGVRTQAPSASLSVVASGETQLQGTAASTTLLTSSGPIGAAVNSQLALASFGFTVDGLNNVSLGVRAIRAFPTPPLPQGWPSTALCLSMDVDDTPSAGAAIFLSANGNVGIGTSTPGYKLSVNGGATASTLYVSGGGQFDGNVGIALTQDDVERDGEPASPLVIHGDIRTIWGGNVSVSGDVLLTGADCAEDFDVAGERSPEPGAVVVIDEGGALRESCDAYDKKVAGVVSGAGAYRHGLILDKRASDDGRIPVALMGKVYCKVDAQYSPVEIGDLLTTSHTPGYAMKATEPARSFGSVIGKALRPLKEGKGLIPILIALQ